MYILKSKFVRDWEERGRRERNGERGVGRDEREGSGEEWGERSGEG